MSTGIIGTPHRLIERYAEDVIYTKITFGNYDVATSEPTASTPVTETIKAYPTNISFRDSQQPNLIGKDAMTFLIASSEISGRPKTGETITRGIDVYEVVNSREVVVRGQVVMYKVNVVRN